MAAGPREAIQTFASLLHAIGFPKTPSEVFRQAKFNQSSVYSDMLELMYRLVPVVTLLNHKPLALEHGAHFIPTTDHIANAIPKTPLPSKQWMLLTVQKLFNCLGYSTIEFYHECSSRELLLAVGWLVCETNFMQKLKRCIVQSAKRSLLPITQPLSALIDKIQQEYMLNTQEILQTGSPVDYESLQRLILINGRLRKQLTKLERLAETYKKLECKVQACTKGRLGVHECYLLTHSEAYAACVRHLEVHVPLMALLLKWETSATAVFKKWIESIAELKEQECNGDSNKDILGEDLLRQRVKELQDRISRFIKENSGYIESVMKHRISSFSGPGTAASDLLIVALKGLKYDRSISDEDILRSRLQSSVSDGIWYCSKQPLTELKEEVERKRSQVLSQLASLQDPIPGTICVNSTLRCSGF